MMDQSDCECENPQNVSLRVAFTARDFIDKTPTSLTGPSRKLSFLRDSTLSSQFGTFCASTTPARPIYPDRYCGPGPIRECTDSLETKLNIMDESSTKFETPRNGNGYRRQSGYQQSGGSNRKRRFREDDNEERPSRRNRYEEPVASRLRRDIVIIGEPPAKDSTEDCLRFGKRIAENFEDDQVRGPFLDTVVELVAEQPLKIPFVAAVIRYAIDHNESVAPEILKKIGSRAQDAADNGKWREFKLMLRFLACIHDIFDDDGIFTILDELFNRVVEQQSASQFDTTGLELVKTILFTIPYIMAYTNRSLEEKVQATLSQTEIVTSVQHPLEDLSETYPIDAEHRPFAYTSALDLLQKQLQQEAIDGWKLQCLPRIYQINTKTQNQNGDTNGNGDANADENGETEMQVDGHITSSKKYSFSALLLRIPTNPHPGPTPIFPETFFSIYADQDVESVPRTSNIASSILRDVVGDTINILHFNRNATAKLLIDLQAFFAPDIFVKKGLPFDKLRDIPQGESTWKTEDLLVDAIFAQMFTLPSAEHKLVYYHSVITEACKLAPEAIAPTLGRAIRFIYRSIDYMDVELVNRFLDWFAHHLSNFDFRWKWAEWINDIEISDFSPKKALITGVIDKEIRLSFTNRIKDTLPREYRVLISAGKEKDQPDFKYNHPDTPFSAEGKSILGLLRKRAPESDIQAVLDSIQDFAINNGSSDPLIESTDAYVTAVCCVGNKSLSHVLSCIDRCKERLLAIGPKSEAARRQIIQSVVSYWADFPGTAVNIVDKLLNYTIITPESVVRWCLDASSNEVSSEQIARGLADSWRYEMLAQTIGKVTNRVRQIVAARVSMATRLADSVSEEQLTAIDNTLVSDRQTMRALFRLIGDLLAPYEQDIVIADIDANNAAFIRSWAERWSKVFQRKATVEETVVGEDSVEKTIVQAKEDFSREEEKRIAIEAEAKRIRIEREKEAEEERERERLAREKEEAENQEAQALDVADEV